MMRSPTSSTHSCSQHDGTNVRSTRTILLFIGARRFPGLINCTAVDFFHPWPRQALISVAARFLEDVELGDMSVKESLAVHMAEEHLSVTKVFLSVDHSVS